MKTALLFFMLCLAAASAPGWRGRATPGGPANDFPSFPGWSAGPVAPDWTPQALGARETRFARDFPGKIALFTDAERTYVVRWLPTPTRRLHPAADCLRALGYTIEPRPLLQKTGGTLWSACDAIRGSECLRVHERILGADGHSWTDVSTWFWQASLGRATGPWWIVTELASQPGVDRH